MAGIRSEVCMNAARKVFGAIPDLRKVAQGMIESGMSRVESEHRIDMNTVPDEILERMAECAGWYVSDENLRKNPKGFSPQAIRVQIAHHLFEKFPVLRRYELPQDER